MDNLSIFEVLYPTFKIKKPIRLIELFAGYGSQALALEYLGIPFEHWKICEWNYKSFEAYKKIHTNDDTDYSKEKSKEDLIEYLYSKGISSDWNKAMTKEQIKRLPEKKLRAIYNNIQATHNLVNVSQAHGNDFEIQEGYTYILTYSFPCQDLSLAGKRKGMSDTSTRSGLLWEVERILKEMEIKPDVLLMENVPQVHGADNMPHFRKWIQELEKMGYQNYWQDMIATDYGIPQIRNRTFMVSIKGDYNYTFPKPQPLKRKLKDLLEENVDEKYFISDRGVTYITNEKRLKIGHTNINPDAAITFQESTAIAVRKGGLFDKDGKTHQAGSIYDADGLSPTLDTSGGGYREIIPYGSYYTWEGKYGFNMQLNRAADIEGNALTISTVDSGKVLLDKYEEEK